MKIGIVRASEIGDSLCARDYLLDAEYEAREIIRAWNKAHANVIDTRSQGGLALLGKIEQGLLMAYERGQKRGAR